MEASGLKSQSGLWSHVSGLRSQVSGLRSQVSGLRSRVSGLRSQVPGRCHPLFAAVIRYLPFGSLSRRPSYFTLKIKQQATRGGRRSGGGLARSKIKKFAFSHVDETLIR